MKSSQSQSGFAVIEAVLVMVILAAVGFVGYYVYHANNQATDTYNAASNTSSTPVIQSKKAKAVPTSADVSTAAANSDPTTNQSSQDLTDADSALTNY